MSYKLICIDVDGTLLGENGIIPEENILAIEQAYKKGVQVVISTGRIYSNAVQIAIYSSCRNYYLYRKNI